MLSLQVNPRPGIILSGLVAGEGSMQLSKQECRGQTKKQADGAGALHRVILTIVSGYRLEKGPAWLPMGGNFAAAENGTIIHTLRLAVNGTWAQGDVKLLV
jgi:hypothetical protein